MKPKPERDMVLVMHPADYSVVKVGQIKANQSISSTCVVILDVGAAKGYAIEMPLDLWIRFRGRIAP